MNALPTRTNSDATALMHAEDEVVIALFRITLLGALLPFLVVLVLLGSAPLRVLLFVVVHMVVSLALHAVARRRSVSHRALAVSGVALDLVAVAGFFFLRLLDAEEGQLERVGTAYSVAPLLISVILVHSFRASVLPGLVGGPVATVLFVVLASRIHGLHMQQVFAAAIILMAGAISAAFALRTRDDLALLERLQMLRRYLSAPAVERVLRDSPDDALAPGGAQVTVTVVSVDFKRPPMLHTVDPRAFFDDLNRRHRVILELADAHGGVLDKFLGEGALVVFGLQAAGAQVSDAGAAAAVAFSRELVRELQRIRDEESATWEIGVGLHSGPVVAGNLGSHTARLEFTVIGDAVNTAARLKELSHSLHHPGIVSGETVARLSSSDGLMALEAATLRGRSSLVTCFALSPV